MFKLSSMLKYGLAAILLAIPLFPKFPFIKVPQTQVAVRLEDFLVLVVSIIFLANVAPKFKEYLSNKITLAVALFLFAGAISTFSGIFLTQTVILHIGVLHWLRRVEYLIVFFIAYEALRNRADLSFYTKVLLIAAFYAFIFGIGQKYLNLPVITTQNSEYAKGIALRFLPGSHLVSTFAGHYDLASYVVLTVPLFLGFLVAGKRVISQVKLTSSEIYSRLILLLAILSAYWLLINAASRISIVGYLASVFLVLVFLKRYKLVPIVVILSIVLTMLSSNLMDRYMRIFNVGLQKIVLVQEVQAQEPLAETGEPAPVLEDRSTAIRLKVEWPRALRAFSKNPILGTGYSSITLATDNGFLRLLGELGALGLSSFILMISVIYLRLFRFWRRAEKQDIYYYWVAGVLAAIPGIMVNMVFIDVLEASKFAILFWAMVGLAVKSAVLGADEKTKD